VNTPVEPLSQVHWVDVYNTAAETAPAFALLQVVSTNDDGTVNVALPDVDGLDPRQLLVNGPIDMAAASYGQAHAAFPAGVLYDPADGTPAAGEIWGAKEGEWKLRKGYPGFRVLGTADPETGLVNVAPLSPVVTFVRITSLVKVEGRYPAKEQIYDPATLSWADGADCWYVDANE
jgi:hypothetical protein